MTEETYTHTLPNGIRCIHLRKRSAVAHCSMTINAGSRDEADDEHGLAHLTEHALFKGTKKRRAFHINNRLENLGGELNAFTTKEETVIHATTLKSDMSKATELISDVIFSSVFPDKEVNKEKEVIYDEINSCMDSPAETIFDEFEDLLFAGSRIGHNILGTKRSLKNMSRETILRFTGRTYNTDQMVFSSVSSLSRNGFIALAERNFAHIRANPRTFRRTAPQAHAAFDIVRNKNTYQAHCVMGGRAYDLYDPKRLVLSLLVNMLGGPMANSILGTSVREKHALAYGIEASYTPLSDTGVAAVYFGTDKDNVDMCLALVDKEIVKLKSELLTSRRLAMAKKQFIGQLSIALDGNEGHMLSTGKSYLAYNAVDSMKSIYDRIDAISAVEMADVANDVFRETSFLVYR